MLNARSFECRSERPLLSLTFDDFAASAWEVGGPVLAEYDATATFYVSAGLLGTEFDGIQLARREWLPGMVEAGHEIGCHTHSHLCLQGSSSRVIEHQLDRNAKTVMQRLEQLYGWLVLYTHDVTDQPSAGGWTPEQLRTVLDMARANGVEIDSVAGSLHRLRAPVITHA